MLITDQGHVFREPNWSELEPNDPRKAIAGAMEKVFGLRLYIFSWQSDLPPLASASFFPAAHTLYPSATPLSQYIIT